MSKKENVAEKQIAEIRRLRALLKKAESRRCTGKGWSLIFDGFCFCGACEKARAAKKALSQYIESI